MQPFEYSNYYFINRDGYGQLCMAEMSCLVSTRKNAFWKKSAVQIIYG